MTSVHESERYDHTPRVVHVANPADAPELPTSLRMALADYINLTLRCQELIGERNAYRTLLCAALEQQHQLTKRLEQVTAANRDLADQLAHVHGRPSSRDRVAA